MKYWEAYLAYVKMITMMPTMQSKMMMAANAISAAQGSSIHQM